MEFKTFILIQTLVLTFFITSLFILISKIDKIAQKKFLDHIENIGKDYDYFEDKENETGVVRNQYIVVLRDNATFIDGN